MGPTRDYKKIAAQNTSFIRKHTNRIPHTTNVSWKQFDRMANSIKTEAKGLMGEVTCPHISFIQEGTLQTADMIRDATQEQPIVIVNVANGTTPG